MSAAQVLHGRVLEDHYRCRAIFVLRPFSVPVCWDVVTAIALAVEGSVGDDGDGSGWVVEEMIDDVS